MDGELDLVLVQYFCMAFLEGFEKATGQMTLAGLIHFLPSVLLTSRQRFPRASRALDGWTKLLPPQQRLPLPMSAAGAIAGFMILTGKPAMAIFVLLSFITYMRPSECMRLTVQDIIAPHTQGGVRFQNWGIIVNDLIEGVPGKTGHFDEAIVLDLDQWILRPLMALLLLGSQTLHSLPHRPRWCGYG